jgi:hypothetical protein
MDGRRLIIVVVILGGGWWFWSHRTRPASPTSPSGSTSSSGAASNGLACVNAAEAANRKLHDAAMLLMKLPVDQGAWSSAQSDVSSALSSADSACGSPNTEGDRKAAEEVKAALDLMRSTMSALEGAARGQGGAGVSVQNQEQIDAHLDRARGFLRG